MGIANYEELMEYKKKISALCVSTDEAIDVFNNIYHKYNFENLSDLKNLENRIKQANFKVIVIGKFSTGKSSLINTLLGEYVLPDSLSPCTAYINEITYGEKKQATIYFKNPLPEQWEDFVQNESVKEHIKKYCNGSVPEFVIPLEDLAECVTIPWDDEEDDVFDDNANLNISPFEKAVIQYPCELCRNGIEIIDSPGLDENQDRTEIVDKYLKKVDAVIYVMTNIATGGDSDKEIINTYLTQNDIKNVFFVCNIFGIPLKMAKKQLFGRLKKVFGDKTLLGDNGIHLVNIRDLQNTGVADFESALADYLNNKKGKAQLTSYIEQLTKLTYALKFGIVRFDCVNDVNLVDVNQKIAANKKLISDDQCLLEKADSFVQTIKEVITDYCIKEAPECFKKLDYNIRLDIRDRADATNELPNSATENQAKELAETLAKEYTDRIEKDFRQYIYRELISEVVEENDDNLEQLQKQVDAFVDNLDFKSYDTAKADFKKLTSLNKIIAKDFADILKVDLHRLVSFEALALDNILESLVKDVFYMYAAYQNENRGTKLTSEIQNKVSLEVYKKLEKVKRAVVENVAEELLEALDSLVFKKVITSMNQEIEKQQANLAGFEEQKLFILDQQQKEHNKSAETVAALDGNLQKLMDLQMKINE